MSLNDLASIGSFVSGIAVLSSLMFLYFQLRQLSAQVAQAERNQQALIRQGRTNRLMDLAFCISDPGLSRVYNKGLRTPAALSSEELDQFLAVCRAVFVSAEDSFLQYRAGLLDKAAYESFVTGMREILARSPGLRAAWQMDSYQFGPDYAAFMASAVLSAPHVTPIDASDAWTRIVGEKPNASAGRSPTGRGRKSQTSRARSPAL